MKTKYNGYTFTTKVEKRSTKDKIITSKDRNYNNCIFIEDDKDKTKSQ